LCQEIEGLRGLRRGHSRRSQSQGEEWRQKQCSMHIKHTSTSVMLDGMKDQRQADVYHASCVHAVFCCVAL
jgi:hypothetical protein